MEKRFSIAEALRFGFFTVVDHFALFLAVIFSYLGVLISGSALILAIFSFPFFSKVFYFAKILDGSGLGRNELVQHIAKNVQGELGIFMLFALFLIFILNRYLALGFIRVCFDLHDKNKSEVSRLFSCSHLIFKGAIASALYFLVCSIGFIFFIVPGIYFAIRYGFYNQFIVDKQVGPLEALQLSAALTTGVKWELFAVNFFLTILNTFSLALFGLSFFITWPLSSLIYVYIYRKLLREPQL